MSAPLVIPFNFAPASVSVKTGAYSIPSGFYAYVTANVKGTGTFTIGGTTALEAATSSITTNISSVLKASEYVGSDPPNTNHFGLLVKDEATTIDHDQDAFTYGTSTLNEVESASFWVPTGTALNITGTARYTVSLYTMPS